MYDSYPDHTVKIVLSGMSLDLYSQIIPHYVNSNIQFWKIGFAIVHLIIIQWFNFLKIFL